MKKISLRNPYSVGRFLGWVDARLQSTSNNSYWYFSSPYGHNFELISLPEQKLVPPVLIQYQYTCLNQNQYTWYTLPIMAMSPDQTKLKLIKPETGVFEYQGKEISGYCSFDNYSFHFTYVWVLRDEWIRPHPNPTPCTQCGWYCSQTCQTWINHRYCL